MGPEYRRCVLAGSNPVLSHTNQLRAFVPAFALAAAVLAAVTDPSSPADLVLAALPVVAFAAWTYVPAIPLWAVALVVVAAVVPAQRSGGLEPLLFEASLLGFVAGLWAPSQAVAVALGLLALAAPIGAILIQDPAEIAVGIWLLGIAFPWMIGRAAARQRQLVEQLDASRRELAQQALLDERRRIARDVHDLVGHGLAAVMLQITSARHVLRRDPAAAEEALHSAEEVGRRSMRELRGTVALLRSDATGVAPPLPSATEIPGLVAEARAGGLLVELHKRGDLAQITPSVGVALYRIAQEALANAARHAPQARTVLELEVALERASLIAETTGPVATGTTFGPDRPRYGLIGMRERASTIGGDFAAGPTSRGWLVRCTVPLEPGDATATRDGQPP